MSGVLVLVFVRLFAICFLLAPIALAGKGARSCSDSLRSHNPLFDIDPENIPWKKIRERHLLPAYQRSLRVLKERITAIEAQEGEPTFENTVLPLNDAFQAHGFLQNIGFVYLSNVQTDFINDQFEPRSTKMQERFESWLAKRQTLYKRIDKILNRIGKKEGKENERYALASHYHSLLEAPSVRGGREAREKIHKLDAEIFRLELQYERAYDKRLEALKVIIQDASELEGIPAQTIQQMRQDAEAFGLKPGTAVVAIYDSAVVSNVLKYARSRALRRKVYYAYNAHDELLEKVLTPQELGDANRHDLMSLVPKIVEARKRRASLQGHASAGRYAMFENTIQKTPAKAESFLKELFPYVKNKALKELALLKEEAVRRDQLTDFEPWDEAYYLEMLRAERFKYDEREWEPYLETEHALQSVLGFLSDLMGLRFEEAQNAESFHPDVRVLHVYNQARGELLGTLHLDLFSRDGKNGQSWMMSVIEQFRDRTGHRVAPVILINLNYSKPVQGQPSFLQFQKVGDLLHELGHALEPLSSDIPYGPLAGTEVFMDFVEFSSKLFEMWLMDAFFLKRHLRHFETGAAPSDGMIDRLLKSMRLGMGLAYLRDLEKSTLDLKWASWGRKRGRYPEIDVESFEKKVREKFQLYPETAFPLLSHDMPHAFEERYESLFYCYVFGETLAAWAFDHWTRDRRKLRTMTHSLVKEILSRGRTRDPMEALRAFGGEEPRLEPFLKMRGFIEE